MRSATARAWSSSPNTASRRFRRRSTSIGRCAKPAFCACAARTAASSSIRAQSRAFAVADHQIAHIYVAEAGLDRARCGASSRRYRAWSMCLDRERTARFGLDHPRSGELVALARPDAWFTYYYWLDDRRAPDFARTVEIHRKPGYDPVELFLDPAIRFPKLAVGARLARRWLGQRALMDVIPLDAGSVRGSHGRIAPDGSDRPLFIARTDARSRRTSQRCRRRALDSGSRIL